MKNNLIKVLAGTVFGIIMTLLALRSCGSSPENLITTNSLELKSEGEVLAKHLTIAKKEEVKTDSVRTITITKWRNSKPTILTMPCDSIVPVLVTQIETIIQVDSCEIASQRRIISLQDSVIQNKVAIHSSDSTALREAKKEIKRQKLQKWLFGVGGFIVASFTFRN